MGRNPRRSKYKPEFRAKVAIEALKGDKSTAELAQIYGVHPAQISTWKKQLVDNVSSGLILTHLSGLILTHPVSVD